MPFVSYSLLRLALFGLALVVLRAVGMGSWLLVVVAALVAWALSYVLLGRWRTAAATWLAERVAAPRAPGRDADAVAEDAEADAADDDAEDQDAADEAVADGSP